MQNIKELIDIDEDLIYSDSEKYNWDKSNSEEKDIIIPKERNRSQNFHPKEKKIFL